MSLSKLLTATLLTLALGSLLYIFIVPGGDSGVITSPTRPAENTIIAVENIDPDFAVYFFYNDIYCTTCEKLENYALNVLRDDYSTELKIGTLQWRTLDMRTAENRHYSEDFGLYSKSIVLIAFENGEISRFNNLEDIWDKVDDEVTYRRYIKSSLDAFMREAS